MTPDEYEDIAYEMHRELARAEQREIDRRVERARAERSHMSTNDRLAEIEARLSAATPGPWEHEETVHDFGRIREHAVVTGDRIIADRLYGPSAALIAHAPTDLAALVAVVREVEALHRPNEDRGVWDGYCRPCGKEWPCPTAAAVQKLGSGS